MPVEQVQVSGSATNTNTCLSSTDPVLTPPDPTAKMDVTLSANAFPQPHRGDPITLSKSKVTIAVPPDLLNKGVTLGVITDGESIPSSLDLAIAGSNTSEKTHKYATLHVTAVVHVVGGSAQPLTASLTLPDTTWHPLNKTDPVFFTQTTTLVKATLSLYGTPVTATFDCKTTAPRPSSDWRPRVLNCRPRPRRSRSPVSP